MHATQTHAARNIAAIFGANLNGLSDAAESPLLPVVQDPASPPIPGLQAPQQIPAGPSGANSFLAVGALAIFSAATRGAIVGGVAASNWRGVRRGALIDASLASIGLGVAGITIGESKFGTGFLLAGILGAAGATYLAVKR